MCCTKVTNENNNTSTILLKRPKCWRANVNRMAGKMWEMRCFQLANVNCKFYDKCTTRTLNICILTWKLLLSMRRIHRHSFCTSFINVCGRRANVVPNVRTNAKQFISPCPGWHWKQRAIQKQMRVRLYVCVCVFGFYELKILKYIRCVLTMMMTRNDYNDEDNDDGDAC